MTRVKERAKKYPTAAKSLKVTYVFRRRVHKMNQLDSRILQCLYKFFVSSENYGYTTPNMQRSHGDIHLLPDCILFTTNVNFQHNILYVMFNIFSILLNDHLKDFLILFCRIIDEGGGSRGTRSGE